MHYLYLCFRSRDSDGVSPDEKAAHVCVKQVKNSASGSQWSTEDSVDSVVVVMSRYYKITDLLNSNNKNIDTLIAQPNAAVIADLWPMTSSSLAL